MTKDTIAIIGASLAGAKAAEGARDAGFEGRVVLIGDEAGDPYERPPLSKQFLQGEVDADETRVQPPEYYVGRGIELVHERAVDLNVEDRRITLDGGETVAYDRVVLATGAEPRRLTVDGAELSGVHYLRTIEDSEQLRDAIRSAARVAVIGAGWIGCEVAASARKLGAEVVLIEPAPVPLQRVLGDKIGAVFAQLHADHGVTTRMGVGVKELRGSKAVEEIALADGTTQAADVVVVGVGITPRVTLAEKAGLRVDNGIVVDEHLAASALGVFAAGDVANAWHPFYERQIRVEHWANALNQGFAAGQNAAGKTQPYDRLPYFFSDQYDLGMEYVGYADGDDELVVRGDLDKREFIAFWLHDGLVRAAMNVNIWDVTDEFKRIISSENPVDVSRLADPAVPLSEL